MWSESVYLEEAAEIVIHSALLLGRLRPGGAVTSTYSLNER